MKRLFVLVPAIILVLFLLNSFVLKKDATKLIRNKSGLVNTVFKSTDGGQTWQDISKGLPEPWQEDGMQSRRFFANDKGLFLRDENGLYHNNPNSNSPFWTKEIFHGEDSSIARGISPYNYWGINLKKIDGTSVWSPLFENIGRPGIRSVFETAGGTVLFSTERGIFKTDNNGTTWKHVHTGGLVGNFAESDGVLLATTMRKIIRSTDNGENWAEVISGDGVAFDVRQIKGGFAAITASSELATRTLRRSYDGGKTWQPTDVLQDKDFIDLMWRTWNDRPGDRLRMQAAMTSIMQVGADFFCTHRDGIFRSSDKGKTWRFLLPSIEDKVFNLFVSGNVLYAIPSKGGC